MKSLVALVLCLFAASPAFGGSAPSAMPKVFIAAADGFDTDLTAAIEKKKTPVTVVGDKTKADFVLEVAPVNNHEESTGSKIARCLFIDCIGMQGNSSVSAKLSRISDGSIVWAYQVRKGLSGPSARQSLSEAIAKHLKNDYLEKQPK